MFSAVPAPVAATQRGVQLQLSVTLTLAPASSSVLMHSESRFSAAAWSAVFPLPSVVFMSQPKQDIEELM